MARTKRHPAAICHWDKADEDSSHYETTCGHAFEFNVDGPVENQFKFCGYCGGAIQAKPVASSSQMRRPD